MKKPFVVLLVGFWLLNLGGCSAQTLKKAEENTRLAGATSPLGAIIYLPVWAASTVANAVSGSTSTLEGAMLEQEQEPAEEKKVENQRQSRMMAGGEETPLD